MDYDVLILGGGIIGCATAYELSKYNLNIALIEKNYDIAADVALMNTDIVYDGINCDNTLMAKLKVMGNSMFDELTSKFNIPFKRCGSFIIAGDEAEEKRLDDIYNRAISRGIDNIALLDGKYVYEMEPNLNIKVRKALYSKNTGVVCPYDLAIAYGEVAFDNGVNFKLEEEVIDIQKISRGVRVITNKNKFTSKMVLNTTPGNNYSIDVTKKETWMENQGVLKYFLLEKSFKGSFSNILFALNKDKKRIYTIPTVQGNMVAAVKTQENIDYEQGLNQARTLVCGVENENINTFYQTSFYDDQMIIDDNSINKGYIKVTGKHYAEITVTPSIAKMICETMVSNMNCKLKKDFNDKRRESYRFRELPNEEKTQLIQMDPRYGKIVCLCEQVTEGEIVDAIRRPLGARTVEGVKRRTGVALGNCQGAYCLSKIVTILAKEMNKNMIDIVNDSKNSKIVVSRIKEFDGV